MKVDVYRKVETTESITGEFWVEGAKQCYYLEPSRLTPFYPGHPCIAAGTYPVLLTMSPHLGYVCPEVLDVPGRTAIRWHIGNFPKDVLGCCVVGTELGENMVGNSRVAFDELMAKLAGQEIVAEYHDEAEFHDPGGLNLRAEAAVPVSEESGVESAITTKPMPDQNPIPPLNPSSPQPSSSTAQPATPAAAPDHAGKGPTINIGEEYGTAKKNLPPAKILLIAIAALLVVVVFASFLKRARPQAGGSLDNVVAVEIPGQDSTMVALTFTLHNTSDKILYVRTLQSSIKAPSGDATADAVSAVDFDRYFQAFPALKSGAQPALPPETKIQPGETATRTIIVAFPMTMDKFNQRTSTSVIVWPYDQTVPVMMTK